MPILLGSIPHSWARGSQDSQGPLGVLQRLMIHRVVVMSLGDPILEQHHGYATLVDPIGRFQHGVTLQATVAAAGTEQQGRAGVVFVRRREDQHRRAADVRDSQQALAIAIGCSERLVGDRLGFVGNTTVWPEPHDRAVAPGGLTELLLANGLDRLRRRIVRSTVGSLE